METECAVRDFSNKGAVFKTTLSPHRLSLGILSQLDKTTFDLSVSGELLEPMEDFS